MKEVKVLYKRIGEPLTLDMLKDSLESFQNFIGGYLQYLELENGLYLVCDEEGLLKKKQLNIIHERYGNIYGDIIFTKIDKNGNTIDLSNEDIKLIQSFFE